MRISRILIITAAVLCALALVTIRTFTTIVRSQQPSDSRRVTEASRNDTEIRTVPPQPPLPSTQQPRILFTDVDAAPVTGGPSNLGAPIAIFGTGFGSERGTSRVLIGGVEVASYLVWGQHNAHNKVLDMIAVQPGPRVTSGPIVVSVNGQDSNTEFSFVKNDASIYYLAPSGSDGKCFITSPCATVLHAVQIMKPGDMLLIKQGTYAEGEIWIRAPLGGTLAQRKVIKAYPGEDVYFTNPARDILVDADYITISGLNFTNGKSLQMAGWASRDQRGDRFINNTFSGTVNWAASETTGHDHLLAGNVCDIAGATTGTMGHCFYITQGTNLRIMYNVAKGATGYGLHIYEERRDSQDFKRVIKNVLVEGNILIGSRQRSGMIVSITDAGGLGNYIEGITIRNNIFANNNHAGLVVIGAVKGVSIYNNTFYQNGRLALYIDSDAKIENVDIRNNIFYQGPNSHCSTDCSILPVAHTQIGRSAQNVTLSNNSYHPGAPNTVGLADKTPITGRIHFTNENALDLHLLPGSDVLRRGMTSPKAPFDFDGKSRPEAAPCDLGAYQYSFR